MIDQTKPMTESEAVAEFRAELAALLKKWGAEISARDHWNGYAECGEDVRMTASICFTTEVGYRGYADIDLGLCVQGDA